jgi:predicted Rdx family selenoprotein
MIESGGGVFEVVVDGKLIFSKKALDRHAEPGEVMGLLKEIQA